MADGTSSFDVSQSYAITPDESRLPELERILLDFKSRTLQEAIYLELHRDIEVRLL